MLADGAVESADLSGYDPGITADFIAARSEFGTGVAEVFTFFGSTRALLPLTVALLVLLCLRHRWRAATAVTVGMSLSLALTVLLKDIIGRVRPPAADVVGTINNGFAFPSGHTLNGTVFFGLVTALVLHRCHMMWTRTAALAGGLMMGLGIGLSRVYLGYHWLTDVAAGWSIAISVLGVVLLCSVLLDRQRRARVRT